MRLLYSLIYTLALAFIFPFEYRKRPESIRKRWLTEKLGRIRTESSGSSLWVHAVSVGEVMAADTFIKALKNKNPGLRVVVSTITDTGQKVAQSRLRGIAEVIYMPFDLSFAMKRAISKLRPSIFIIMETEIWPNAIWCMKGADVPVVILNGRISDNSFGRYRNIRFFMKYVFNCMDMMCMQDEEYARRIIAIGAPEDKVKVTGSFKFDIDLQGGKPAWGSQLKGPVMVAGSTHRGEESLLFSVYEKLKTEFGNLNLIIAPRHPERFDEIEELLKEKWLNYIRKTQMGDSEISGRVVLLDTVGELSVVYSLADVAVIGGSFIEHGGQNPLEAAYWEKPVVCGPHMENFPFTDEFYARGAAVRATKETLLDELRFLLRSPERRKAVGEEGAGLLKKNRGAVERAIAIVEGYLRA